LASAVPCALRDLIQKRIEKEEGEKAQERREHYQMGKTMVFMREEFYYYLEEAR